MAEASGVLVLAEHTEGRLSGTSTEVLGAARRVADALGGQVAALTLGQGATDAAQTTIEFGADRALVANSPSLTGYRFDLWLDAIELAAREVNPTVILLGQTSCGRELAPRLAVRLGTGVAMDCIALEVTDGRLLMTRPVYGGKAHAQYSSRTIPAVATLRAKAFETLERDPSRAGEVTTLRIDDSSSRVRVIAREEVKAGGPRLEDAKVIVAGGRGIGSAEGFELLQELAEALGGAVGSSRPPIDLGWTAAPGQIGLTGKMVAPELYIAVGISGASQHMAGLAGAKNIVAINKDRDAEVFKSARYGVVANWRGVVEELLRELRR
jgi:electron transfer flavoprotein alpha subunit